jgi:hypothetical protein
MTPAAFCGFCGTRKGHGLGHFDHFDGQTRAREDISRREENYVIHTV